ncbi:MAG TPA: flagellar filament capping protein FliD [Syntrophales bacterium]|nr:flagellar filament capping protein FliD [Syntrophales bacterium]
MATTSNVGSSLGTSFISGLSSGIDWSSVITQLMAVDQQSVTLVQNQQSAEQAQLTAWQSFNTQLLSLKTAADALNDPSDFSKFNANMSTCSGTSTASNLLSVSVGDAATVGSYTIKVDNLAQAQKLSSNPFTSSSTELGSSYAGDIVINGKVVTVSATDTLADVAASINEADTGASPSGVTATVVNLGTNNSRLILTSDATGAEGISLLNGSSANLVQQFGWKDNQTAIIKNSTTSGAQSDLFTSSTTAIQSLLGLSSGESGNVTIGNKTVHIDLSAMSLTDIENAINTAAPTGVTASVISETDNGNTYYRLQIDGTQAFTDANNILNTIGVLDHTSSSTTSTVSGNSMTSNGSDITASTLLKNIDGYTYTTGDSITLSGMDTSGNSVNATTFNITGATTVQDLLNTIDATYGGNENVLAYVTSDGKIRVDDLSGNATTKLNVSLNATIQAPGSSLAFGAFGAASAVMVAGKDATVEVEGVPVNKSSNTIDDIIPGVTLNLLQADNSTTINLNVAHDIDTIKSNISNFVTAYNSVASYIRTQNSYNTTSNTTGGVLFGDGTLASVKSDLTSLITQPIWGVNSGFSIMGLAGINLDDTGQLSVNDTTLTSYLQTNFNDIMSLFVGQGVTSSNSLTYVGDTQNSKAGLYTVLITTPATQCHSMASASASVSQPLDFGTGETLTIGQGNQTANVSLKGKMNIGEIINAINTELSTVYTQTLAGSNSLTAGGQPITSNTTWSSIDGAGLSDGNTIQFSGTDRNGSSVGGTYTINNAASDTVQGLLSAIESAFSNDVTASIDASGRIAVQDKSSGASLLSLNITSGLDFGSVLATNSGGQTGRYAMDITASNNGSDQLVLTSNAYGISHNFSIAETNGKLLWGTQSAVINGTDVAGTINGESATGSGQVLTGNKGNANTEGISITYTGTSGTPANPFTAGTVKLTRGVADLFDTTLFNITDPYSGYISFKETSLQNGIDNFQTKIDEMNAQLDQKKQQMTNEFVAMEVALNNIQNQSNWLAGQVTAATNGWQSL